MKLVLSENIIGSLFVNLGERYEVLFDAAQLSATLAHEISGVSNYRD